MNAIRSILRTAPFALLLGITGCASLDIASSSIATPPSSIVAQSRAIDLQLGGQ